LGVYAFTFEQLKDILPQSCHFIFKVVSQLEAYNNLQ